MSNLQGRVGKVEGKSQGDKPHIWKNFLSHKTLGKTSKAKSEKVCPPLGLEEKNSRE